MTGMLTATGIWKIFGNRPGKAQELSLAGQSRSQVQEATGSTVAVRDVSFDIASGETFVIMGLSGSGKSTLLRCVACLTGVTAGTVALEGDDLTAMTEAQLREVRRAKMSMVFQHFGLFPHRRVIDNAAYGLEVQGVDRATRHRKANEILELVGLGGWGQHYPQQLSGGMQQRVGLARALVVEPSILFFDEPFSALDPLIRRDMQDELLRLQVEMNRTIVFVTHDFDEAIKLGDRIAIMRDGVFDQVGTAQELIANPATDYVREFTKDISRAKVLTAADVLMPADGAEFAQHVLADATVESFLSTLLSSLDSVGIVDARGQLIGQVNRNAVRQLLDAN
jgi:glycine betaine/proline transport system ATP-binding protein